MSENGAILQIDVDGEIQKIVRQLNDLPTQLKAPTVLARAMNLTANEIKRKIGKQARKKYAITDDRILKDKSKGAMYLEKATGADPAAVLISKGGMMEVMAYTTRKNDSATAAMLKVLNESKLTALEVEGRKAFETTGADTPQSYSAGQRTACRSKNCWPRLCHTCTAKATRRRNWITTAYCKSTSSSRWKKSWRSGHKFKVWITRSEST